MVINAIMYEYPAMIKKDLFKGKALLLFGPRQSGKSMLIQEVLKDTEYLYLNGDDADVREMLTNTTATKLKMVAGNKKIVFIDEAPAHPKHWTCSQIIYRPTQRHSGNRNRLIGL